MRHEIFRILKQHGELTLRELCAALNCYTEDEIEEVCHHIYGVAEVLGGAALHPSSILRPSSLWLGMEYAREE